MEVMEYKGSVFSIIREWGDRFCIKDIESLSEEVWFPESYEGSSIINLDLKDSEKKYYGVRVLYIPETLDFIKFGKAIFPDLEKVIVDPDNKYFTTDGKMLFSERSKIITSEKGSDLARCLVCKGDTVTIPDSVKYILSKAFYGTEFSEIIFPKSELTIVSDAFENSKWESLHEDPIVIGNLLFKAKCNNDTLVVPNEVKRFQGDLFNYRNIPHKLVCKFMPLRKEMRELIRNNGCASLEITSPTVRVNLNLLKDFTSLEEIILAEGHKKYKTIDGVMYSSDGKTLVFYPRGRKDSSFSIPEGVEKIAIGAFAKSNYLTRLVMPDSIKSIGTGAFSECKMLSSIRFSSNLEEIPDTNSYNQDGVFEGCKSLGSVVLPEKLKYLGSFAFYDSGVYSIILNKQLEQIGEYALATKTLKKVSLPASVKRLGRGSLFFVRSVEAYEGTARGLVSSINSVWPYEKDALANLRWDRCEVTVLHKGSEKRETFIIPESLNRNAAYHLDAAWNQDFIDYSEYEECIAEIKDSEERMEITALRLLYHLEDEEDSPFFDYIKKVSFKLSTYLLQQKNEAVFLAFLKRGLLSDASLQKLLKLSNDSGMTVCSAYIVEQKNKQKGANSSLRL